ncbi:MAG TPA: hypothetical protein PLA71_00060 [Saccharofermentans sp.]|nr:hypothetical protein [Saccharofermentans sp.]
MNDAVEKTNQCHRQMSHNCEIWKNCKHREADHRQKECKYRDWQDGSCNKKEAREEVDLLAESELESLVQAVLSWNFNALVNSGERDELDDDCVEFCNDLKALENYMERKANK